METGCGEGMRHGDRLKVTVFAEMLVTHRDRQEFGAGTSGRLRQGWFESTSEKRRCRLGSC